MTQIVLPYRPAGSDNRSAAGMMSDFDAITAVVNGNLDATNMAPAFAKAAVEPAFSGYRTLQTARASVNVQQGGAIYFFQLLGLNLLANNPPGSAATFDVDSGWFAADTRTTKFQVAGRIATNAVAPGITFTWGLYSLVLAPGTAGNTNQWTPTVVGGSTVALATPGANALSARQLSGDFTAPASGVYALGVTQSGTNAANSCYDLYADLLMRQV